MTLISKSNHTNKKKPSMKGRQCSFCCVFLVIPSVVATIFAVCLLPHFTVSDWGKTRTTAPYSTSTIFPLRMNMCGNRGVVVVVAFTIRTTDNSNSCNRKCSHNCETQKELLHNSIHCFVSCATFNC